MVDLKDVRKCLDTFPNLKKLSVEIIHLRLKMHFQQVIHLLLK